VGRDMPIETENLAISMNVTRASFPAIYRYVRQLNFLVKVSRSYEKQVLLPIKSASQARWSRLLQMCRQWWTTSQPPLGPPGKMHISRAGRSRAAASLFNPPGLPDHGCLS
jgi:hypothetical protein